MMHLLSHQHTPAFISIQIGQRDSWIKIRDLMRTHWPLWCGACSSCFQYKVKEVSVTWIRAPWSFNQSYMAFHAFHSHFSSYFRWPKKHSFPLTLSLSQNQKRWPPYNPFALPGHPRIQTQAKGCERKKIIYLLLFFYYNITVKKLYFHWWLYNWKWQKKIIQSDNQSWYDIMDYIFAYII